MTPVRVKLDDADVVRLDEAVARGLAANRSDATRTALRRQLIEWDSKAWDEAWATALPGGSDEFAEVNRRTIAG